MHTQIYTECENGDITILPAGNFSERIAMITRHHVVLTILCTLILCSALVPFDPVLTLAICLGACTGTLLPDIQMKRPRGLRLRTPAWLVSRFARIISTPLMCRLYGFAGGYTCDPADKHLTHSVPGILFLWGTVATAISVPLFLMTRMGSLYYAAALLGGVMIGLVLHLVQDLCTKKGIVPFFPFSTMMVSGSIRPCDGTDRRIAQYKFYACTTACILLGFRYLADPQGMVWEILSIFGLVSCLVMMVWSSDAEIIREPVGIPPVRTPSPALSDPFLVSWRASHPSAGLEMGVYYLRHPPR